MKKESFEDMLKRYNIDLEKIKQEQIKLAKSLELKDAMDFKLAERFAAVDTIIIGNQIIAGVIVCDKNFNILDQQYSLEKLRFPYIHGFRSYRELTVMVNAFNKLQEPADVVLIRGHGISHPRLGLASHFSLSTGIPAIGIAGELFEEDKIADNGEDIFLDGKKVGMVLKSKEKANPLFISPGNKISIKSAFELCKSLIRVPHKHPEPLHLAHKYVKNVRKELKL